MNKHVNVSDDEGLGLIELIVAVVVSSIVLAVVITIFVNSWITQKDVLSVSQATNRGQLVGSMIEKSVRNAIDMKFTPGANGDTLLVRTSLAAPCQGFYIGEVTESGTTTATVTTASSSGLLPITSAWSIWTPGITLDLAESTITESAGTVSYSLLIETESAPVRIEGEVAKRNNGNPGGSPCW